MSPCRQARNRRSDYSLSRHSPYTSKSNPGHLRASSTRPVLICMCMAHCFAQKKHLRDAGAFVMYVTRFELATFWSVARRSIQLSYTYISFCFLNSKSYYSHKECVCQSEILKTGEIFSKSSTAFFRQERSNLVFFDVGHKFSSADNFSVIIIVLQFADFTDFIVDENA